MPNGGRSRSISASNSNASIAVGGLRPTGMFDSSPSRLVRSKAAAQDPYAKFMELEADYGEVSPYALNLSITLLNTARRSATFR